ncbi:hypothetical protein D8S78_06660 [Natrialba swarupiae]|nr:hypothetical protein [Natrialba swarupiae]
MSGDAAGIDYWVSGNGADFSQINEGTEVLKIVLDDLSVRHAVNTKDFTYRSSWYETGCTDTRASVLGRGETMKRRTFLSAIGAGSITAGALVGTESVSRIEAQRRVKLEVAPVMDLTGISFVAFCGEVGIESIEVLTANDEGEPVEIEWSTDDPVDEVILKGEQEWYRFDTAGATSGTAIMAEEDGGVLISPDWPNRVEGDDSNRCPPSPCKGETGTKLEYDDGFSNPEATKRAARLPRA